MQYRRMGKSGLSLSALSLGGWTTFGDSVKDEDRAAEILKRAFDAGVNFFDSADIYAKGNTERVMGKILAQFPRHELVVSTKVFWPMSDDVNDRGLSRKHIHASIDQSLARLGLDHVDLYFCHRFDPDCDLEETVRAMHDVVTAGKALYWGTSEWTGAQLREAHAIADKRNLIGPSIEQPQYSLLVQAPVRDDVGPVCQEMGMGMVAWSPLASGALTGKYDDGVPEDARLSRIDWLREQILTDDNLAKIGRLKEIANDLGCTRAQLAIAYAMRCPQMTSVILGATKLHQLDDNLGALNVELDAGTMQTLQALFEG